MWPSPFSPVISAIFAPSDLSAFFLAAAEE